MRVVLKKLNLQKSSDRTYTIKHENLWMGAFKEYTILSHLQNKIQFLLLYDGNPYVGIIFELRKKDGKYSMSSLSEIDISKDIAHICNYAIKEDNNTIDFTLKNRTKNFIAKGCHEEKEFRLEKKRISKVAQKSFNGCARYENTVEYINFYSDYIEGDDDMWSFDATSDGIDDCVLPKQDKNDPSNLSVTILTKKKKYNFQIIHTWFASIDECGRGCLHVTINGKYKNILDSNYYYNKKYDFWFNKENLGYIEKLREKNVGSLVSILGIGDKNIPIDSLLTFESKLSKLTHKGMREVDSEYLDYYLEHYQLTIKNLTTYNNIAYYLQKAGANEEAVYLLEKILEKFPKRTVAYYNLGDAYWALGDKKRAIKAYMTYIEQMKAKGKEKRIPKVVKQRVSGK